MSYLELIDAVSRKTGEDSHEVRRHGFSLAGPDDANWTGAEIKSCCRLASLLDVPLIQASQNVVPVAVTAGDKVEQLRQWASGRCLSADRAGVYSRDQGAGGGMRGRRVMREPGRN